MNKKTKILAILSLFLLGAISAFAGATYAYYQSTVSAGGNVLEGKTNNEFNATISLNPISTGELIPLRDDLLSSALGAASTCIDSRGYQACGVYQLTITNNGSAQDFNAYITTKTGTTVATGDIKYQLFTLVSGTYTAASDVGTITVNADNYITETNNNETDNLTISLGNGTVTPTTTTYYLAIWLSDNNNNQPLTQNKKIYGTLSLVSANSEIIKADFTS